MSLSGSALILEEWSPAVSPQRVQEFAAAIESLSEWMIVVEENDDLLGFGSLTAAKNEFTSVYVDPAAGGRGIGRSIVDCVLNRAYSQGLEYIQLDASLNSVGFYEKCGFKLKANFTHKLASGKQMECCVMEKSLTRVNKGQL